MKISHIKPKLNIYGFGPSFVIWTQGCSIQCSGCWNKDTWDFNGGFDMEINSLLDNIVSNNSSCVTILGGEPFDQYKELYNLCYELNKKDIGIILYSGYTYDVIQKKYNDILQCIDVLIAGPYIESMRNITNQLYGSENQQLIFITNKYTKEDIINGTYVEVVINPSGMVEIYGYPDDFIDKHRDT